MVESFHCFILWLIVSRIVTDRLAYLNFVQGSLASSLAQKLDAARSPLKALRDAETSQLRKQYESE